MGPVLGPLWIVTLCSSSASAVYRISYNGLGIERMEREKLGLRLYFGLRILDVSVKPVFDSGFSINFKSEIVVFGHGFTLFRCHGVQIVIPDLVGSDDFLLLQVEDLCSY